LDLLELYGRHYVIDHVLSEIKKCNEEETFKNYVTDVLRYIVNNTAEQESRVTVNTSYRDLIHPVTETMEEDNEKQSQNIIANIRNKLKGG